jgi:outer membrane immunogenic protein
MLKLGQLLAVASVAGVLSFATPAAANDWAGWYVGASVGGGNAEPDGGTADLSGAIAGGHIGYNWQTGNWVGGFEGDFSWSGMDEKISESVGEFTATATFSQDWLGTLRGRIGYSTGPVLVYGTFGFAFADYTLDLSVTDGFETMSASESISASGIVGGGGLEWAMSKNWSLRGEALWYEVGEDFDLDNSVTGFIGRGGLTYRF